MKDLNTRIHPLADVKTSHIGKGTHVWQFAIILEGAVIGENCNINCHTFIESKTIIGDRVTVKSGIYLWDGIEIGNDVFLGPNVTFINDKYPRSKRYPKNYQNTRIDEFASIGAAATILGGVHIGRYALIGAGSLVTKDVPAYALVIGNPGRVVGTVDSVGHVIERF